MLHIRFALSSFVLCSTSSQQLAFWPTHECFSLPWYLFVCRGLMHLFFPGRFSLPSSGSLVSLSAASIDSIHATCPRTLFPSCVSDASPFLHISLTAC
ncbi:hypothetical protein EDD17DRAFT_1528814 [Pisolithus thermaeus]|nr:hypothetical protein EV401DRAFT_1997288 [Pisolithus croceorrhizus]KAI6168641.1 hypothetical protein EDD17DRAFT_1528814 [Pisolithus thermaeus]